MAKGAAFFAAKPVCGGASWRVWRDMWADEDGINANDA